MEFYKAIVGYEGLYEVSNLGNVRSLRFGKIKILKQGTQAHGYLKVVLCVGREVKNFLVHRLVAQAFLPNPNNKPAINHVDGNKQNNHANNLEWAQPSENTRHGLRLGLIPDNRKPVVATNAVTGVETTFPSIWDAAKDLGLKQDSISRVVNGRRKSTGGYSFKLLQEAGR